MVAIPFLFFSKDRPNDSLFVVLLLSFFSYIVSSSSKLLFFCVFVLVSTFHDKDFPQTSRKPGHRKTEKLKAALNARAQLDNRELQRRSIYVDRLVGNSGCQCL